MQHRHLLLPPGNYHSRRQMHLLPADWASWVSHPQLSLRLGCPSVSITLLHGTLYDGLPAVGRPALTESTPWAAAGTDPTPVLDISLSRGLDVRHIGHRGASSLDVDVPALVVVTTSAAGAAAPAPEQLRLVDLAGLKLCVRASPTNCHWRCVPGLDAVLMGVGETSRDVAVSIQRLDLGT